MAKTKKHLMRLIAFVLCLIIIFLDTANMPVLATTVEETSPITNEQIAEALSDAQIVLDEEDEFSDGTSDVNWDELGNIQSDYDYLSELYAQAVANDPMPLGIDLPGDDMVYLTQKWLNQEYGDVNGFVLVKETGKTGWDTIYGLTRALQHELGITNLAKNFGPQTQAAYQNNILSRQDGATNNMYAILQGALWCKGYSPGYNFDYNSITDTVTVDAVFDERVEEAVIEMKTDAGLINPNGVVTLNTMKALLSMDAFKLLKSYGGIEIGDVREERFENGRNVIISILNTGLEQSTANKIKLNKESVNGELIESFEVETIESGSTVEYTFTISEDELDSSYSETARTYYLSVETDSLETNYSNNDKLITVYPDYMLSVTSNYGGNVLGSGTYANNSYASISAIPSSGYQFEGWYEDGVLIAGLPQNCELAVNRNRTLEARFKKTNLEISKVSITGELKTGKNIEFTATANGGTMPYSWSYFVSLNGKSVSSKLDSTDNIFKYKPEKEGNYTFTFKVKDSSGNIATYEKTIRIKSLYKITVDKPLDLSSKIPDELKISYWYSSDERVASVNGNGVVTGKRVGTTTITAVTSGGAKLSWEVEVGFTWWQIFLIFTGIGAIMLPFWIAP